jgi:hypothetical protein
MNTTTHIQIYQLYFKYVILSNLFSNEAGADSFGFLILLRSLGRVATSNAISGDHPLSDEPDTNGFTDRAIVMLCAPKAVSVRFSCRDFAHYAKYGN